MKKTKWLSARYVLVPILIVTLIYVYIGNVGVIRESITQDIADGTLDELTGGTEIGQSFYYHQNNLSGVSIKFATYMRNNNGSLQIGIKKLGENKDIYQTTVQANSIKDNEYFDFRFPPIKYSKGNVYYIYIKSLDSMKGQSITAYMSKDDSYKEGSLYINGEKQYGDLVMKAFYNRTVITYISEKVSKLF